MVCFNFDESFEDFCASRKQFMRLLGEPLFLESFGNPHMVFYIFGNGAEGELGIGRKSAFETIHSGPFQVLVDKHSILSGATFHEAQPEPAQQTEKLRRLLYYFWHEWQHFTTALGRGQLWWAQGQLESLRGFCVSLARLSSDFFDHEAGVEPYFKVEKAVPVNHLSALKDTYGPLGKDHLRKAGLAIAQGFKELALPLAQAHGIPYPEALEQLMLKRLDRIL